MRVLKYCSRCFFLFPEEKANVVLPEKVYETKISIKLKTNKRLCFFFSERLAQIMAENFLGETTPTESEIKETLKEFVNMIGGNLVSMIGDDKAKLGLPQVSEPEEINISNLKNFDIDGEFLGFRIERYR